MHNHPTSAMMIYEARQQEREAEARKHQFQRSVRARSKAFKLVANLSHNLGGVLAAITQASTGLRGLAENDDAGQPKAA
jgi:uncharacterized membrane protein